MATSLQNDDEHYNELVNRQVEQYRETVIMHDLPPIYDYWSAKFNALKFKHIIGMDSLIGFYASYFQKCLEESDSNFLISVGSGDSSIEIAIVKELIAKGFKNFSFICLELSPILIEKARSKIIEENLEDIITADEIDINNWKPTFTFAGVMAHHSLHHILDLELLFGIIKNNLAANGRFLTADMIGRNGHMRWPESLVFIRNIWNKLPRKYKFNHQLNKYDDYFDNWDCSNEGFEGIRAQDILPILVNMFSFEVFYAYGGLIDIFIDRGFGANYNPSDINDTQFIDFIEATNEQMISEGILKPTIAFAVLRNEEIINPKIYKNWSPEFCIRFPLTPAPIYDVDSYMKYNFLNFKAQDDDLKLKDSNPYFLKRELKFSNQIPFNNLSSGIQYLKYGWNAPETDLTWSSCDDASLILPISQSIKGKLIMNASFLVYHSPVFKNTIVEIFINGSIVTILNYKNEIDQIVSKEAIEVPFTLSPNQKEIEIRFLMPNRRQPQYENGPDLRALGIALISLTLS